MTVSLVARACIQNKAKTIVVSVKDRMLAAQSELGGLPLISGDTAFTAFRVQTMW